ncbi:MAG: hypothetical protein HC872_06085 [Gammaproteobacteria bacterium]|nr:hypothetical protein [Gammaproteobacteria bacterium]
MNPRKPPRLTEFADAALDDMKSHTRNHGSSIAAAFGVWRGSLKSSGLPAEWLPEQSLQDAPLYGQVVSWRIYVHEVHGMYLGFAETLGAEVLVMLSFLPTAVTSRSQAVAATLSRIPWNSRHA